MAQIKVGDQAPDFATVDDQNKAVKLSDLRGKRVVLYFYPKDDTPGCTRQACGFRDNYSNVEGKNSVVLGVSPDDVESHQAFKSKFSLPFPLLVDTDHAIAEAYSVWGEREVNGNKFMGIFRSSFVIDEQGKVVDAHYNVSPEESVESALAALA
ncbi:MAG TPA: thioredoxin-dependent thiol peroxidase [Dehalococcoidia bacterium]|jgi:peroxiredoxin Q/BCP|nr:thioredoxin-dependent thiol peroxidase [Dehalococcoidia bacterium]